MYKILILSVFFFSSLSFTHAATTTSPVSTTPLSSSSTTTPVSTTTHDRAAIEKMVKTAFADTPVMIEVARCESNFRQFTDAGTVLRGGGSGGMIGVFQFYEAIHSAPALALGFDLNSVEGNIAYAKHLYKQSGVTPWQSCVPATAPAVMSDANKELQIKLLTKLVELLTELLKLQIAQR